MLELLVLLTHLIPCMRDPKLLAALQESRKRQAPYAGAFRVKDEPGTDPSLVSGSESEKNIYDLKGKDLLNRLHEVGTLAQISSIQGDQVVLIGHRRLQMTEMDKPYNKDDDVIKATSFEVISTLRDVLKTSSLWRDHVQTYTQLASIATREAEQEMRLVIGVDEEV
ncbi:lon protease homolog 1, mitochondrial [Fagus crenata]